MYLSVKKSTLENQWDYQRRDKGNRVKESKKKFRNVESAVKNLQC